MAIVEAQAPGSVPNLASGRVVPGHWPAARALRWIALGLAVGGALATLGWSLAVLRLPYEALSMEAVTYEYASRILRGDPLYPPLDQPPHAVALQSGGVYTPLYPALVAGLRSVLGDGFGPGRGLSLVATLFASVGLLLLARRASGHAGAGWLAAALFLTLALQWVPWAGVHRPDALGLAFSVGSLVAASRPTLRRVVLAGLLAGGAVLTKQTFLAAGLAIGVWLLLAGTSKRRLTLGAFGLVWLGLPTLILAGLARSSPDLFQSLVASNVQPFSANLALGRAAFVLVTLGGVGAAALGYAGAVRISRGSPVHLVALYGALSLAQLAALAKVGSSTNYLLEPIAAAAVLAAGAVWAAGGRATPVYAALALLNLVLLAPNLLTRVAPEALASSPDADWVRQLQLLVDRVRAEPGPVLADPLDVVVLAGHAPALLEPFGASVRAQQGLWDPAPLVRDVCAGRIALLILAYPLTTPDPVVDGIPVWPPGILPALRDTMRLDGTTAGRYVYVPRLSHPPGPSATCEGLATDRGA